MPDHHQRLTCRELLEFLADFLDRSLPAAERERFEWHLDRCPPCRDYLRGYVRTMELAREACDDRSDPPRAIPEELVRAVLDARRR